MDREQESFVRPRARIGTYSYGKFTLEGGWEFEETVYAYSHEEIDKQFDGWQHGAEIASVMRRSSANELQGAGCHRESRASAHKELDQNLDRI